MMLFYLKSLNFELIGSALKQPINVFGDFKCDLSSFLIACCGSTA